MTYYGFKRHFTSPNVNVSQGLTALLNSFVLREKGKFHDSKMSLWKWLKDKTLNGHTYYAYGKEAALDSIIYRLLESMPEDLQQKFSLKTNYSQSCSYDPNHDSFRTFRHNVLPVRSSDITRWCNFAQLTSNRIRSHNLKKNRIIRKNATFK